MSRLCKRCQRRPGIITRARLLALGGIVEEIVCLCNWCRIDATTENAIALSRRTQTGEVNL